MGSTTYKEYRQHFEKDRALSRRFLKIDVGEPSFDRIKKACRLAKQTYVYCFNSKADVWWKQSAPDFSKLPVAVYQFDWQEIKGLAAMVTRTMDISVTLSGESAYFAGPSDQVELTWQVLQLNSF